MGSADEQQRTGDPALTRIADGVWLGTAPVRPLRMRVTTTMTVLRLRDDSLLLCSPIAMSDALRAAVEALGAVRHLYAPNLWHHLWIGEWAAAFPQARVHAPAGLARKRPELRVDRVHGGADREPAFAGVVDEIGIAGFRLQETVLFHRQTRTLVVADLVSNLGRSSHAWTRLYTQAMGFSDRVALSRMIRWLGFRDRSGARRSVDDVLALPFERIVVGHGAPIVDGGREALTAAYTWLPPLTG